MAAKKRFKLGLIGTDSLRGREIKNILGNKKMSRLRPRILRSRNQRRIQQADRVQERGQGHPRPGRRLLGRERPGFPRRRSGANRALGRRAKELGVLVIDLAEAFNDGSVRAAHRRRGQRRLPAQGSPHHRRAASRGGHPRPRLSSPCGGSSAYPRRSRSSSSPPRPSTIPGSRSWPARASPFSTGPSPKKSVFKEQIAFNILSHTEPLGRGRLRAGRATDRRRAPPGPGRPDLPAVPVHRSRRPSSTRIR